MSTYYTFTTELIYKKELADELEEALKEEVKENPNHFGYTRTEWKGVTYFAGHNKNLGGGFYEWCGAGLDIKMVWVSDENEKGSYGFD
jgi:hypothetical protein